MRKGKVFNQVLQREKKPASRKNALLSCLASARTPPGSVSVAGACSGFCLFSTLCFWVKELRLLRHGVKNTGP